MERDRSLLTRTDQALPNMVNFTNTAIPTGAPIVQPNLLATAETASPAVYTPTTVEMNMAKAMLPEYSGGSKNLAFFIKQVESYIELLKQPNEHSLFNKLMFEQIKAKLVGEARDILITSSYSRWSDIKTNFPVSLL
ncbi:hypothetical protein QE152_g31129 [Popillia japonica]|uniref:Uncharacterized protein n=1 Tax=Popillia japonica TaxID=7064 RepID=A0AAW1JCT3_POPJA